MATPTVTIDGRLTGDPELRFTAGGKPVTAIRLAASDRKKVGDQWEDGDRLFIGATVWQGAEDVAGTVRKGDRVLVTGRLISRDWEDREGNKRSTIELAFATVAKVCADKKQDGGQGWSQPAVSADPWAASAATNEVPF